MPFKLLGDFKGYLQSDGYSGYNAVSKNNGLVQVGCWAHARSKFDEALKSQKPNTRPQEKVSLAADAMHRIQMLYQIERQAKNAKASSLEDIEALLPFMQKPAHDEAD